MEENVSILVFVKWVQKIVKVIRKSASRKDRVSAIDIVGAGREVLVIRFENREDGIFFDIPEGLIADVGSTDRSTHATLLEAVTLMLTVLGFTKKIDPTDELQP